MHLHFCLPALLVFLLSINTSTALRQRCWTEYGQYPTTSLLTSTRYFGSYDTSFATSTTTSYYAIEPSVWITTTITIHTVYYSETILFLYTSTTTQTTTFTPAPTPTPTPTTLDSREAAADANVYALEQRARSRYPTFVICNQVGGTSTSTLTATTTFTYSEGPYIATYEYDVTTLPTTRTLGIDYSTVVTATTTVTA